MNLNKIDLFIPILPTAATENWYELSTEKISISSHLTEFVMKLVWGFHLLEELYGQ